MAILGINTSWRNNLYQASFRGVPFFVEKVETEVGRRSKVWYRFEDYRVKKLTSVEPLTQDYGRDADIFTLQGYILANSDNDHDYFQNRDLLISALKRRGPGILIHPFFGEIEVIVAERARIEESFKEGGVAKFSMKFLQSSVSIFPETWVDYISLIDQSALDTKLTFLDDFLRDFRAVGSFIQHTVNDIGNLIQKMSTVINSIAFTITSVVDGVLNGINNIVSSINSLINAPCNLAEAFVDAADKVQDLTGITNDLEYGGVLGGCSGEQRGDVVTLNGSEIPEDLGISVVEALIDNFDFDGSDLGVTSTEQQNNQDLSVDMMNMAMLINLAQIAIRISFSSQDQMIAIMNKIAEMFEDFLDRLGDTIVFDNAERYKQVQKLYSDFVSSMTEKNAGLAKEIQYKVDADVLPTLVLAYNKYEDVDRCSEILDRNKPDVRHPGFLPSGDTINILDE